MKKISLVLMVFTGMLIMNSCQKILNKHSENEIKETLNVEGTVQVGGTYSYTLPANQSDDPYQITLQATKFVKSELNTDANGNVVYTFQPSAEALPVSEPYTQDITLANVEEEHPNDCGNHSGEGHHGRHNETEVERTIHIHLTVTGSGLEFKQAKSNQ